MNSFNLDISVADGDLSTDPNAHSSETSQVQIIKNNPPTLTLIESTGIARENEWLAIKTDASFQLNDIDADDSAANFTFEVYDNGALSEFFEVVYDEDAGQYFIWQRATIFGYAGNDTLYGENGNCLLYTSPSPRDLSTSRMPSSA